MIKNLSPEAFLRLWPQAPEMVLIDVRERWEWEIVHIENSQLIPLGQLPARFPTLAKEQPLALLCHHGMRSLQAAYFLQSQGFDKLINIQGGIDAWSLTADRQLPRY